MLERTKILNRKYHDGDIVEFDFRPDSLDINGHDVTIIGVVSGIVCEDNIMYKIQLRDNDRNIFGEIIVPEEHINGKIE